VTARYRIHFRHALARGEDYEKLMKTMATGFSAQGAEGILKARAVEERLMVETWHRPDSDLTSRLRRLRIPTLLITGERDFIPVKISENIARAIPDARLVTIRGCGHFACLECASEVRDALDDFFQRTIKR
jgi:pimeloyl-ACP methyl ester carboxylesterase